MASGYKTATVNASSVPATATNFPAYVDLSRLGITTLAEAQSVRVYADSGKTTEWAREIVSATEMHVKVPSLTSTTDIYVDWDGVRSDYAVADTYGRNAVWSDYNVAIHLATNAVDSAGNATTISVENNITYNVSSSPLGSSADFNGSNSYIRYTKTNSVPVGSTPNTVSYWVRPELITTANQGHTSQWTYATSGNAQFTGTRSFSGYGFANSDAYVYNMTSSNYPISTWVYITTTNASANNYLYINGSLLYTSGSRLSFTGQGPWTLGRQGELPAEYFDGQLREVRTRSTEVSANWITTEYNNQSDEATFWGSWSTVGGAAAFVPKVQWLT